MEEILLKRGFLGFSVNLLLLNLLISFLFEVRISHPFLSIEIGLTVQ